MLVIVMARLPSLMISSGRSISRLLSSRMQSYQQCLHSPPRPAVAVATRGPAAPLWGLEARACQRGRGREGGGAGGREEEDKGGRQGEGWREGGREQEDEGDRRELSA